MKNKKKLIELLFIPVLLIASLNSVFAEGIDKLINVGGRNLHIHCIGEGELTIVLISGATSPASHWFDLPSRIVKETNTRTCFYNRAGFDENESVPTDARSGEQIVDDLHTLLTQAGITGPLILGGHSRGTMLARIFEDKYPDNIVAMVLIDPGHEFTYAGLNHVKLTETEKQAKTKVDEFLMNTIQEHGVVGALKKLTDKPAGLTFEQYEQVLNDMANPKYNLAAAAEDTQSIAQYLIDAKQLENTPLGDKPLRIIRASNDEGEKALLKNMDQFPPDVFRAAMSSHRKEWKHREALTRQLSKLSNNTKYIIVKDSEHNVHHDNPKAVADVFKELVEHLRLSPQQSKIK